MLRGRKVGAEGREGGGKRVRVGELRGADMGKQRGREVYTWV